MLPEELPETSPPEEPAAADPLDDVPPELASDDGPSDALLENELSMLAAVAASLPVPGVEPPGLEEQPANPGATNGTTSASAEIARRDAIGPDQRMWGTVDADARLIEMAHGWAGVP
jgi:hypothetical protein